ncbi:DUF5808 domain-containing protein [Flavobacterium cellulosilyticum]|uniref:DUF5808 domain-containing protein n=1 Tax=Flavobacterium cellulosilyticum TaxID=2541731 RepID=A0A4R5CAH7_9FLAO|nr:DUF5808 domain-containing protein [Flavobacterium cellulosilyticum]TDD95200.1 hypothetical protein E0F76_14235 [Flavobacterium cellulosilyticum]
MKNPDYPTDETSEKWRKDPNKWIWGIFYYNKEDKRIFPPKKIPWMGFTTNFANTKSVLSMIAFLLLAIFIVTMISRKH